MAYSRKDKEKVLAELEKQMGNVTQTCKACGIPRSTFEHWLRHDKTFAKGVKDVEGVSVDFCAYKMFQLASQGNFKAIKYVLSTKGRGYGWGPENGTIINNTLAAGEITPPAIIFTDTTKDTKQEDDE